MRAIMSVIGVSLLAAAVPAQTGDDPLLRPIAPDHSRQWLTPQPPTRIHGETYLVGFGGLNVALIRTNAGLILIDGAVPQAVRDVEENVRRLGFRLADVKLILVTEPHYDHAGGVAALARDTGATVVASAATAAVLRTGRSAEDDPQAAHLPPIPTVGRVRVVRDGEVVRLGNAGVTARLTPGHTSGSTSWTWRSCEERRCVSVVFAASLNPISADGYRFSDPANRAAVTAFRRGFAAMRAMPCDLLLTAHPANSGGEAKLARLIARREPNPFIDRAACRTYADTSEAALDRRLASEAR